MREPEDQITYMLQATASVTVTNNYGLGRDASMPVDQFPLAEISESLDDRVCSLCAHLDGMIIDRNTPSYDEYRWPSHINCRRIMVYIGKDEIDIDGQPMRPNFQAPPRELLEKHGHFHIDPDKYAELRMPARPEGRDFVFSPGQDGQPGALLWMPGLSDQAIKRTIRDMLEAGGLPSRLFRHLVDAMPIAGIHVGRIAPNIDLDTFIDIWDQLSVLARDFPEGLSKGDITLTMGTTGGFRAPAEWDSRTRQIVLRWERFDSAEHASSTRDVLRCQAKAGALPEPAGTVKGVVSHEYGHSVYDGLDVPFQVSEADRELAAEISHHTAAHVDGKPNGPSEVFADCFAVIAHTAKGADRQAWNALVNRAFHAMRGGGTA